MADKALDPETGSGKANGAPSIFGTLTSFAALDQRALLFAFAMLVGAVFYFSLSAEPSLAFALGALAGTGVLFFLVQGRSTSLVVLALALSLFAATLGFAASAVRTRMIAAPQIKAEQKPAMIEGWVTSIEQAKTGVRLRIDVHAISGLEPHETPKAVRLTHTSRLEVSSGRFVRCWAVLRPPPEPELPGDFDFRRQAWFQELGAVGYVQGRCRGGALGRPGDVWRTIGLEVGAFRRMLGLYIRDAAGERAGGFTAAMVTGDRSLISAEDEETLRAAGLSHLLAVSGLNMAIAGGLVFFLVSRALALIEPLALRVAVKRPAALVALISTTYYFVLSGMSVPAQRAYVMCIIVFGAVMLDRSAINLRSFALSMIVILLLQPDSVMSPGFQMSFAATGALVAVYEAWSNHRQTREQVLGPIRFSLLSLPVTSIAAGVATMPFSIYHFDRQAALGLIANFAAMPIITYLSAPAAALALLLAPFGQADFGLDLFGRSLEAVLSVASWAAEAGPESWSAGKPMPGAALGLIAAGMALCILLRGSVRVRMILFLVALGLALWLWRAAPVMAVHVSASGDVFVTAEDGQIARVSAAKGDGLSPLRFADIEAEAAGCDAAACRLRAAAGDVWILPRAEAPALCAAAPEAIAIVVQLPPEPEKPKRKRRKKKGEATTEAADAAVPETAPLPVDDAASPALAVASPDRLPARCGANGPLIVDTARLSAGGAVTFYAPPRAGNALSLQPLPARVSPKQLKRRQPPPCGNRTWRACS